TPIREGYIDHELILEVRDEGPWRVGNHRRRVVGADVEGVMRHGRSFGARIAVGIVVKPRTIHYATAIVGHGYRVRIRHGAHWRREHSHKLTRLSAGLHENFRNAGNVRPGISQGYSSIVEIISWCPIGCARSRDGDRRGYIFSVGKM